MDRPGGAHAGVAPQAHDSHAATAEKATPAAGAAGSPAARAAPGDVPAVAGPPRSEGGGSTTLPAQALWKEEIASTGRFVALIFAMLAVLVISLPFLGGDPTAKRLLYAGAAVAAAAAAWLYRLVREPARYTGARAAACWGLCTLGALAGVYFFGAFSPAPALLCLGIYFVALGQSRGTAWLVYGLCAAFQGALAALILTGAIADRGFVSAAHAMATREAAIVQALVQACLLGAFWLGRGSRRAKLAALRELDEAKRAVAAREDMLEEAREDLDRALRVGDAGRFSEHALGSFRLGPVIGRGAMGDVYEARHRETGEPAAVKLIQPERIGKPENRTRFSRELAIARALEDAHVARVLEVSEDDAPVPYLAMERLVGETLAERLRARRRLPAGEALEMIRQVGAGASAAARAGIVHRDLKPQNVFRHEAPGAAPLWKILDFGVSKLAEGSDTLTHGRVIGTPAYMAPEQARGERVDHRADVYALGAIAYRVLTGQRPFRGGDPARTLYAVMYTMPPRPSDLADVPLQVDGVLAIALTKEREARFDSAADLVEALHQAMRGELAPATRIRARELMRKMPWAPK